MKFVLEMDVSDGEFTEHVPAGMVSGIEIAYRLGEVQKRLDDYAMKPGENGTILSESGPPIGSWRIMS